MQEEVRGQPLPIIVEEDRERFEKAMQRLLAGGSSSAIGVPYRAKDGRIIRGDVEGRAVRDLEGKVVAIMAVIRPSADNCSGASGTAMIATRWPPAAGACTTRVWRHIRRSV